VVHIVSSYETVHGIDTYTRAKYTIYGEVSTTSGTSKIVYPQVGIQRLFTHLDWWFAGLVQFLEVKGHRSHAYLSEISVVS